MYPGRKPLPLVLKLDLLRNRRHRLSLNHLSYILRSLCRLLTISVSEIDVGGLNKDAIGASAKSQVRESNPSQANVIPTAPSKEIIVSDVETHSRAFGESESARQEADAQEEVAPHVFPRSDSDIEIIHETIWIEAVVIPSVEVKEEAYEHFIGLHLGPMFPPPSMGGSSFVTMAGVEPHVPAFPTVDLHDVSFEELMEGSTSVSQLTRQPSALDDDAQVIDALLDDEETDANKDKTPKVERFKIKLPVRKIPFQHPQPLE